MKSMRQAHVVVLADNDLALLLVARLRRMTIFRLTVVADLVASQQLCRHAGADVCIVSVGEDLPDAAPHAAPAAPGRGSGVPSLLFVSVATPYWRGLARHGGYLAVVPMNLPPRLFYRCIAGVLQQRRTRHRRAMPAGMVVPRSLPPAVFGKPTCISDAFLARCSLLV